jgi:alpha-amylase/alpha-mannosidase (GH57 family)
MKPLKIAFLWHQHQPDYRFEGESILPWVIYHGVKDYYDLPEVLHEFPDIKQTYNLVPSLNIQIEDYISGRVKDRVQELSKKNAGELTDEDKQQIIETHFRCNEENLINPFRRYKQLLELSREKNAIEEFTEQDWRDLQVWYNLCWFGFFSKQNSFIKRLHKKEKNFSEGEKTTLLNHYRDVLSKIIPQYKTLMEMGQIEVSCSPYYHPILPLLCDSASALEAMPNADLPEPPFKRPEDAQRQIELGINHYKEFFGKNPEGIWPSEGSVSDEVLGKFISNGVKWVATDEMILSGSEKDFQPTNKFFPRKFRNNDGEIAVFFRDRFLSDRIGFVYSGWNEWDAANDFCHHLRKIRNEIIRVHGDEALDYAVVPVILDGENCWEYYYKNGVPFLRELYKQFSEAGEFRTVTMAEAAAESEKDFIRPLEHIKAGSWINANFSIWIGHQDDRRAWELLSEARNTLEKHKSDLSDKKYDEAFEHILVAEGSDWFWWYGPEHYTDNKDDFDYIFRSHIASVYKICGLEVPEAVLIPVAEQTKVIEKRSPLTEIGPVIDGSDNMRGWENAGFINLIAKNSAMHQAGEVADKFFFGHGNGKVYIRLNLKKEIEQGDEIEIILCESLKIHLAHNFINITEPAGISGQKSIALDKCLEIAIPLEKLLNGSRQVINATITTRSAGREITYPDSGNLELDFSLNG